MTFIPLGIWLNAPGISVGLYIWKGIIPTLLGNIIGGGLFVGKNRPIPRDPDKNTNKLFSRNLLLVHVPFGYQRPLYPWSKEEGH